MLAIMLAAGVGRRLSGGDDRHPPKALLQLGGRSLLARHLDNLRQLPIDRLHLVVGYRRDTIEAELAALGAGDFVTPIGNPDFRKGSLVSLMAARGVLDAGEPVLFMDADVLYHPALLDRLLSSNNPDCLIFDRDFEPGDEPVKLCLKAGRPVEFRKQVEVAYDTVGEWPGFLSLSADSAREVAAAGAAILAEGREAEPYEEAFRAVILGDPARFHIADITGLPWIEIDFPADLERARREVLPLIEKAERG